MSSKYPNNNIIKRQSNIELLRLLAMMLVIFMHGIYNPIPIPTSSVFSQNFVTNFMRMWFSGLTYVNVDVFVLISGWFGIKLSSKSFANILFQCFFCASICILCAAYWEPTLLSSSIIIKMLYPGQAWWFVSSYLGLMILSPMINAFVEKTNERQLRTYLICFYSFQMVFGLLFLDSAYFLNGISVLSLSFVYLLGRYLRLYPSRFSCFSIIKDLSIYLFCGFLWAVVHYFCTPDSSSVVLISIADKFHANSNPVVILGAVFLFLAFTKISISPSKVINWFACSSFAIYLIHCNPVTFPIFLRYMKEIAVTYSGVEYILIVSITLLIISVLCILIDKIRLALWNKILPFLP